jgi:hypothetical protein
MDVYLDKEVFGVAESLASVLTLLAYVAEGRHNWRLDLDSASAATEYLTTHAPLLYRTYIELIERSLAELSWAPATEAGASNLLVTNVEDLVDTVHDLARAGSIVVEDLVSDRFFIEAILAAFSPGALHALESGWIRIVHSGGKGRMVEVARNELAAFRRAARVVAILDSDKLFPDHVTPNAEIAARLVTLGVTAHVLRSREAENYIPNRALAVRMHRPRDRSIFDALTALTADQRAHYDFKRGFRTSGMLAAIPLEQSDLYAAVAPSVLGTLGPGRVES